jgi:hypothetical protein
VCETSRGTRSQGLPRKRSRASKAHKQKKKETEGTPVFF